MDLIAITRLVIALGYATAAVGLLMVARKYRGTTGGAHATFAAVVAVSWAIWYFTLGLFDLPIDPWGSLNRALHFPIIAFLYLAIITRIKGR